MDQTPVMLDEYVRKKRRRALLLRCLCAAVLLAAALVLRIGAPDNAKTVRAWIFGGGEVNRAVSAFYEEAAEKAPLSDAVEAFCVALDG